MKILFYMHIFIATTIYAIDIELITKIKPPIEIDSSSLLKMISVRNDGALLSMIISKQPGPRAILGICYHPSGKFAFFIPRQETNEKVTRFVSPEILNGVIVTIEEELNINKIISNDGSLIMKTISENGYMSNEKVTMTISTNRYKISSTVRTDLISSVSYQKTQTRISKQDSNGKILSELTTDLNLSTRNLLAGNDWFSFINNYSEFGFDYNPNNKIIYLSEIADGKICIYRLTDPALLSSQNRITLGSSQNGSLTATVNNPEQALLNIQSSTNLIDWNTFKTIQNEPSLEIVVPANKPKEFIRAIE